MPSRDSKRCNKCEVTKPVTEFYKKGKGYKHICKVCASEYAKERSKLPHVKELSSRNNAKYRYKITDEQLDYLRSKPCDICGGAGECIDHNHETNEVRGTLCHSCNTGLGKLKDSPKLLRAAADYLEKNGHYGD